MDHSSHPRRPCSHSWRPRRCIDQAFVEVFAMDSGDSRDVCSDARWRVGGAECAVSVLGAEVRSFDG